MSVSARLGLFAAIVILAAGPAVGAPESAPANRGVPAAACAPGIHHATFRSSPQLCPQPLAMTLIERKVTRRYHT